MSAYLDGSAILGADFQFSKQLDDEYLKTVRLVEAVKPVTYAAAVKLLALGDQAMSRALQAYSALEDKSGYIPSQITSAQNDKSHLDWHRQTINAGLVSALAKGVTKAVYPNGDDLKNWVKVAFRDYDAALESNRYADEKLSFWSLAGEQLADLLTQLGKALDHAADSFWARIHLPWWVWTLGAATVVGTAGYFTWPLYGPFLLRRFVKRSVSS